MSISPWPYYNEQQISAVSDVLSSGKVNAWTGSITSAFEEEFSRFTNCSYSIALANGSLALSAAYLSLGIGELDEVITAPRTFIATASSLVLLGAIPIFADVDINSGCITADSIEPLITPRTKAISVVHLGGWPADMQSICNLAKSYGLAVIEDCAQAHGSKLNNQPVGSFGDVSAWSFCQDKIISTGGEGGMVSTQRKDLWDAMWSLKDHGKSYDLVKANHPPGFRWLHHRFGSNFRLTEMQSALGRLQLSLLPEWHSIRTRNALVLANALSDISAVRVPLPPPNAIHAWYKFYIYVDNSALAEGWSRDRIISEIVSQGYPASSGSCSEVYLERCFVDSYLSPHQRLPVARSLGETSLMFLVHPTITISEINAYADVIRSVLTMSLR